LTKIIIAIFLSLSLLHGQNDESFDDFQDEFKVEQTNDSWDPLKFYNIPMTQFNDFVYMYIMGPIADGYRYIVPKPIREGTSNVFHNIQFPIRFTNNLLQLNFNNALEESVRFAINSTYGIAGFIDIAKSDGGIERHNEDFGQTLGYYGMSNDIHIVLPLLGPSNLRDTIRIVADSVINPISYMEEKDVYFSIKTYDTINEYSLHMDEYENIRKDSLNLYILLKSVYEQRRNTLIEE